MRKYRRLLAAGLFFLFLCSCETGLAGSYDLPSSVTELEEEAFAGDTQLQTITLKSGLCSIGSKCFYGCSNLYRIAIPKTVTSIGAYCFDGCPADFVIQTTPGSYAMQWARDHHVDFQANTKYRALLIAQTYDSLGEDEQLKGPAEDVQLIKKVLSNADKTRYEITIKHDLNASEILAAIDSCFGGVQDQDVSLFYYSGHGISSNNPSYQGALLGANGNSYVTASNLRQKLDQIPGRKIILLDSCFSGAIITNESGTMSRSNNVQKNKGTANDFVNSFISVFSSQSRDAAAYNRYYIMTAAADNEESYERMYGSKNKSVGLFTVFLSKGLGYDWWNDASTDLLADSNANGAVSFREAFQYVKSELSDSQHAQMFPSACNWMGIIRRR